MRRCVGLVLLAWTVCMSTGCASMSNTAKGATAGGLIGAGTGAIIGDATTGKAGKGALIGGTIGTIAGAIIGNEEDQREKADKETQLRDAELRPPNATSGSPMGITDVIQLNKDGVAESVIIGQIRSTGSTFQLSTEDLRLLQSNSVPANVILEMQNRRPGTTPNTRYAPPPPPRTIYVEQPAERVYIYQPPVYVVPPPPPRPGFGVGIQYRR